MRKERRKYNQDTTGIKKKEEDETTKEGEINQETNQVDVNGVRDADSYQTVYSTTMKKR